MGSPPQRPAIYHITHIDNLARIIGDGHLFADSTMAKRGDAVVVGMQTIKERRLRLEVSCHRGDYVGDYVPFYFCPRSVMLYVLHMGNAPELKYRGGQEPILHLEADLKKVVEWANQAGRRWAFTLSNAGASYTEFRSDLDHLAELDWDAIAANDWRDPDKKEGKQAEFLVHESFPFSLIRRIGVRSETMRRRVEAILWGATHRPSVTVIPGWYY